MWVFALRARSNSVKSHYSRNMKIQSFTVLLLASLAAVITVTDAFQIVTPTALGTRKDNFFRIDSSTIITKRNLFNNPRRPPSKYGLVKSRPKCDLHQTHYSSSPAANTDGEVDNTQKLGNFRATVTKVGMISYIVSLCISLPLILIPPEMMRRARIISTTKREILSLRACQFCCRWLLRLIPFAKIQVTPPEDCSDDLKSMNEDPEPSIWVCNHTSMLDVFFLLAADKKMRGQNKRPIKIVYWKQLEDNPVTKILFRMCGFIPIQMEANEPGEKNKYDTKSFKIFLRAAKQAFTDGFDIGILPEGQLNPSPESGLLPVFSGAYTLAKMSRRPIKMIALNGAHKLWHATEGMKVTDRIVHVRAYPNGRKFESSDDFSDTFMHVVGHFGATGKDVDNLDKWLEGNVSN